MEINPWHQWAFKFGKFPEEGTEVPVALEGMMKNHVAFLQRDYQSVSSIDHLMQLVKLVCIVVLSCFISLVALYTLSPEIGLLITLSLATYALVNVYLIPSRLALEKRERLWEIEELKGKILQLNANSEIQTE